MNTNSKTAIIWTVSDFVAVFNQTLENAYPSVTIVGELANLRISKNRWLYFDLKDETSSIKFFGSVQQLPGPLEDGMMLQVIGVPRLHNTYGFSLNVQFMTPIGEGSIKKAARLLQAKLVKEGLFALDRKRAIPHPPQTIGLITSSQSAAYHDFIKILQARWGGIEINLADVQVQGELAVTQIVKAIDYFNNQQFVEVLVVIRGGGNADDLAAFNTEPLTRAVAGSRTPTVVAIGHEVDFSLAEMAADLRASTPSNAAELLVPDKSNVKNSLNELRQTLTREIKRSVMDYQKTIGEISLLIHRKVNELLKTAQDRLLATKTLVEAYNPTNVITRGYAIIRADKKVISSIKSINLGQTVEVQLIDGNFGSLVSSVEEKL